MPITFERDTDTKIVIATCSGVLGLKEAQAGASQFWGRPESGRVPVVWDFRSAVLRISAAEIHSLAEFILSSQPTPPPPKVAFVTGRDVDFGLVRMFEVYRQHPETEVQVFRDYDKALAWARVGWIKAT